MLQTSNAVYIIFILHAKIRLGNIINLYYFEVSLFIYL